MTAENAIRFLGHEARRCHELTLTGDPQAADAHAMLCLVLPAILKVLELETMDTFEARAFEIDLYAALRERLQPAL